MRDVLIDVRCLQSPAPGANSTALQALELLAAARAALPDDRLVGLVDRGRPALPASLAAMLDAVRGPLTTGAVRRPACLVQLSPLDDPLFVIRFLRHPAVASLTVPLPPLPAMTPMARAARLHWHAQYGRVVDASDPAAFWSAVALLQPGAAPAIVRRKPVVALVEPAPQPALLEALARIVDLHVLPPAAGGYPPLTFLSGRFDRWLGVVGNEAAAAPVTQLIARHGGACLVRDPGLLAVYGGDKRMAEAELGRPLGPREIERWTGGEVRPGAMFLGELAESADPLLVHSNAFAAAIRTRFGREVMVVPRSVPASIADRAAARFRLGVCPRATLLAAVVQPNLEEDCLWALELLRFWGAPARLHLIGPPAWNWPHLRALAARLGIADQVALMPQRLAALHWDAADCGLMLSVGANSRAAVALQEATVRGLPCVATHSMAMSLDAPDWVRTIPDEPSPVLLAEAILSVRATRPSVAAQHEYGARHSPAAAAAALCAALAL